jgi:hypothetical protein
MEDVLLFVEEQQTWIYILFGLFAAIYLKATLDAAAELRASLFGLERERSMAKLRRSAGLMTVSLAVILTTFVLATYAGPAVPAADRPTPLPTVSLLATPEVTLAVQNGEPATAIPLSSDDLSSVGCANTSATMTSPVEGAVLQDAVDIQGTADIPNFSFYKYEYRSIQPDSTWRTISAGTTPVVEGKLGTWDTSLLIPGDYALRLVVTDTAGNAPLPCVMRVTVAASSP